MGILAIRYFVNNFNFALGNKNRRYVLDVYVSRRKEHIHIAFDRPLMSIENSNEIISQILNEC